VLNTKQIFLFKKIYVEFKKHMEYGFSTISSLAGTIIRANKTLFIL